MVHAAFCHSVDVLVDPVVADALTTLHTVEFCRNWSYTRLILEGDSLLVVHAINRTWVNWSRHENIIADIKEVLTSIYSWKTCNTKQRANSTAHILAQVGAHHATHRI
jgi:ribonuclease HI